MLNRLPGIFLSTLPKLKTHLVWSCLLVTLMASSSVDPQESLVVVLVRHAEKIDSSDDPDLSTVGVVRATALASALRDARIEHVHSTDFKRTRNTSAAVASTESLDVEIYDPNDLAGLATKLKESGGRHLVVGHSNTTPQLVELLGGDPGEPIDEPSEYDRMYVITISPDGTVHSMTLRYGAQ